MDRVNPEHPGPYHEERLPRAGYLAVCVLAFAFFTAGVYAYAHRGGPLVDRLSGNIGELIVERAKGLVEAGDVEGAVAAYRQAFQVPFEDPRQREWALMDFGGLLIRKQRPDEAVPVLRECLATFPDARVHDLLCAALFQSGEHEAALRAANAFLAFAKDNPIRALAYYHIGAALEALDDTDAALSAYLEGSRLDPASHNTFHAAALLQARGRTLEALRLLDQYIPHGSGWRLESARKRREAIVAEGAIPNP
ncbi:MAG: hypothetical protein AMXMBFR4_00400 [Candidatus Hydrogenedentota bacterium]